MHFRFSKSSPIKSFGGVLWALALIAGLLPNSNASGADFLWQIGKRDNSTAEFALAPRGTDAYKTPGLFVVGESDPRQDWPYVHPGPQDTWAGARQHTFLVVFGLQEAVADGQCALHFDLVDTHASAPPRLRIEVNGKSFEQILPKGAGDASVQGDPGKGKEFTFQVPFPASLLRSGDNEVRITTLEGSWFLYDWLALEAPANAKLSGVQTRTSVKNIQSVRALMEVNGKSFQPVTVSLLHYGAVAEGVLRIEGAEPMPFKADQRNLVLTSMVPAVTTESKLKVKVEIAGRDFEEETITLKPVRKLTVYVLPHSHTDIGYTEIQTEIERKQVQNLLDGIAGAKKTADYPAGARFVWNVEVAWAADLYLRRLDTQQRTEFFEAVKKGQVSLNGMYLNELTGLCRPEELVQLFRYATKSAAKTGVAIDSAMISDVPGYTWGTVSAMAQAGIKYFSVAPNYFDRIGTILREWENKPFYWQGPDSKSKVLVWIPFWGYAMSHRYHKFSPQLIDDFCAGLEQRNYPYDIAYVRWAGEGDNAVPDPQICDFIRDWNAQYTWPKFIVSSTSEAFRAFEAKYGAKLPVVKGDWTPYWEDGAGSSALETGMNRQSSDRLVQAETLYAMRRPDSFPAADFENAWNSVLLYSEHTWGAYCSISDPKKKETVEQWQIKQSYALDADKQSKSLLHQSMGPATTGSIAPDAIEVFNTTSWSRTERVTLASELSLTGDRVTDHKGRIIPSQRLSTGELAFLASEVPPFGSALFKVTPGQPGVQKTRPAEAGPLTLQNSELLIRVDEKTGAIIELKCHGIPVNLANTKDGGALNDFLYFTGPDPSKAQRNGPVRISVKEKGPIIASLLIESSAPGCKRLVSELRLSASADHVEILNLVDKERLVAASYYSNEGKESLNFGFSFNVPKGEMLLDIPLGRFAPETGQMPSACKNWLTVGRWADIANHDFGITWVTLDAPLIQLAGLTANLLNSQTNPDTWLKKIPRTQKIYSWAMNNHWGTNYRAYQEGPTWFRFILRPHRRSDPAEASRFATGFSQPLAVSRATSRAPLPSRLTVSDPDILITAFKPSDDGKAWIVRVFNAGTSKRAAKLTWAEPKPGSLWLSDTRETARERLRGSVELQPLELATIRAEKPAQK